MKRKDAEELIKRQYEWGKSVVVSDIYYRLQTLANIKNKKIQDFIHDFCKEYEDYIPIFGDTEPTAYEKKFCFCKTYEYRGQSVDIYNDDAGQQYYFYYKGKSHSCGSFNPFPEEYIEYIVDADLDTICNMSNIDNKYAGAFIKYANHEHTEITFTYRLEELKHYTLKSKDEFWNIDYIINECQQILNALFSNEEFIKSENERRARGDLYFNEMLEEVKRKGED